MIDGISRSGASAWPITAQSTRLNAERPAISIYQAPSQRVLSNDTSTFASDRLMASLAQPPILGGLSGR